MIKRIFKVLNVGLHHRRKFALLVLFSSLLLVSATDRHPKDPRPNILVILIDDAGYADFGFMGSKDLVTPNLDKLAAGAVRFSDAHVTASVCSPSRAGLLTGRYQQRFGYECNDGEGYTGMDTTQQLFPAFLQRAKYATAAFGKWHLGYDQGQQPLQKGFDYFYGFLSGGRSYFYRPEKDDLPGAKTALFENNRQVTPGSYLTDALGDKAVDYIREHQHQPFFMYWAPNAVHTPLEASEADLKQFVGHPRQKLAAMTLALDRSFGKIISELKRDGLFENTLIFFLSDNGGAANNQSTNIPLKGFKGNKFEGGHRVPFLVSWPKQLKGGTEFNGLSSALDIAPTILAAAGVGNSGKDYMLDGVDLIPYLKGIKKGNPHEQLVWRKDAAAAIRFQNYKLIRVAGLEDRLYDLKIDPGETNDLHLQQPAAYGSLKQKLREWETDKKRPAWTEGQVWDTITLMIHDDLMHNRKVRVRNPEELQRFRSTIGEK